MHYHWDLAMVLADTDRWWHGIGITLLYSVATVAGGIVIGVFCGLALLGQKTLAAESARGVSPRAAHRSRLDTLASSGSCHRTKAAASRRELELSDWRRQVREYAIANMNKDIDGLFK